MMLKNVIDIECKKEINNKRGVDSRLTDTEILMKKKSKSEPPWMLIVEKEIVLSNMLGNRKKGIVYCNMIC